MNHAVYSIPITTYQRPNGTQRTETFDTRREAVYANAIDIIEAGFRFEFEVLSTGHGHLTVSAHNHDVSGRLVRGDDPERMAKLEDWILGLNVDELRDVDTLMLSEDDG